MDRASIGQDGSQRIKKPSKAPAANQLAGDKGREISKGEVWYLDLSLRIGIDPVDGRPRTLTHLELGLSSFGCRSPRLAGDWP